MKIKILTAIAMVCAFAACHEDTDGEIQRKAGGVEVINSAGNTEKAHGMVMTMSDYETEITLELVSAGFTTVELLNGNHDMTVEVLDNPFVSTEENERLKYTAPGDREWSGMYKQRVKVSAPELSYTGYVKFRITTQQYLTTIYWCDIEVRKTGN